METLKDLRKQAGKTVKTVAQDLSVNIQAMYRYEMGASRLPLDLIVPLAEKYGCSIDDVVFAALATIGQKSVKPSK